MRPLETPNVTAMPQAVTITPPSGDTPVAYAVEPGSTFLFDGFELGDAELKVVGDHLVISVEGAPDILMLGFVSAASGATPPMIALNNDTQIDGTALLQQLAFAEQAIAEIEPAAGPQAGSTATRSGFLLPESFTDLYSADPRISDIIDGFGIDLSFDLPDEELPIETAAAAVATNPGNGAAVNDTLAAVEDTPLTFAPSVLTANDIGNVTFTSIENTSTEGGTLSINGDGNIVYTPAPDFNGPDTVTYTVTDENGNTSTAIVTINVAPVNDAPIAVDDNVTAFEDTPLQILTSTLLANDIDVDGDVLQFLGNQTTTAQGGTVSYDPATGILTYTPPAGYNGPDSFTYTIDDGNGERSSATVNITVQPVNNAPIGVDDVVSATEDTVLRIDPQTLLANDIDADGDTLNISGLPSTTARGGTIRVDLTTGEIIYTPPAGYVGPDSFVYTVSDGNGGFGTATVTINVGAAANNAPIAGDDSGLAALTTPEDTTLTIDDTVLLANDTDSDGDTLTIVGVSSPSANGGTVSLNADGDVVYTPAPDFNGTDTFTYTVSDGNGGFDTATVTVNVTPVNDDPVAGDDSYLDGSGNPALITAEDNTLLIDSSVVLANDTDVDGDTLTISAVSGTSANGGTVTLNADGNIVYTPAAGFDGTDTFTYTISDGNGGFDTATVTVNVTPSSVNTAPVAGDDNLTTGEGVTVNTTASNLLANDTDVDGDSLTITAVDSVSTNGGTITFNPATGAISYTPAAGFNGSDSFTYTVSDGNGGFDTGTVNVNVTPAADLFNVVVAMDISGSMIDVVPGTGGKTHLDLTVEALQNLVNQYQALGENVQFSLITFDNVATTYNFTLNDFQSVIDLLTTIGNTAPFGSTNYADALDAAAAVFDSLASTSETVHNLFYFLSDGMPAPGQTANDAMVDWQTYITENGIESHAYGFHDAFVAFMNGIDNTGGAEILASPEDLTPAFETILRERGVVLGTGNEDTLDGGDGGDSLYGQGGDDTLIYDKHDPIINGGSGFDTLLVADADTINLSNQGIQSIEQIDLTNGGTDTLSFTLSDVIDMTDNNILRIDGDAGDQINAADFTNQGSNITIDGTTYATFSDVGGSASIYVELGMELNSNPV